MRKYCRSLEQVYPGDKLDMQVYTQYDAPDGGNYDGVAPGLAGLIAGSLGNPVVTEGGQTLTDVIEEAFAGGGAFQGGDATIPRAYLQYLFFDEQYQYQDENSGFIQVPETAETAQQLLQRQVTIAKEGFMLIYVVNESQEAGLQVFFDDLEVTLTTSEVVSATDYYPFGSPMKNSYAREDYRFGFQGQFAEKDEETGWNSFELRMYDAVIGRWLVPDPFRQYWSPYVAFGNNPVSRVDPDGGMDDPVIDLTTESQTLALSEQFAVTATRLPFSFTNSSYDDIVGFFLDLFTGGVRFTLFGRGDLDFGSNAPDNVRVVAIEMSFILDIFNALGQKFPKDQKPIVKNDTRTVENKSDRERVLDIKDGVEKAHELYHQNNEGPRLIGGGKRIFGEEQDSIFHRVVTLSGDTIYVFDRVTNQRGTMKGFTQ